jgi:hypothetical protein
MAGNDFVMVQLTGAGEAMAQGHPLRISVGHRTFLFQPGTPLRVERSFEWLMVLARHFTPTGDAMVELAPVAAASTDAIPSTAASTPSSDAAAAEASTAHEEAH